MTTAAQLWFIEAPAAARLDYGGEAKRLLHTALSALGMQNAQVHTLDSAPTTPPKVTVALGMDALRMLVPHVPDDGIQALRGYWWDAPCGRVLGTLHPTAILREWNPWRALFDVDLRRARDELATGAPPLPTRHVVTVTQVQQLEALRAAIRLHTTTRNPLSCDIENTEDFQLACVGFAPTTERAWVIPATYDWQKAAIRELLESPAPKVFQNGQYDRLFNMLYAGTKVQGHVFDTQLAWHALNPELAGKKTEIGNKKAKSKRTAKSLKFLASIYTRDPWWKDYEFTSDDERYRLCGKDCCITLDIARKQLTQLDALGLRHIADFEQALLDPFLAMTMRGMPVNDAKRRRMIADLEAASAPLAAETSDFVCNTVLAEHGARLKPEKAHLFRERTVCKCCRNGKGKREACWACAGFDVKPSKKALGTTVLAACTKCGGAGAFERTVFNPNSPEQIKIVLYELLKLPARTKDGALTTDEKALKSLLAEAPPLAVTFIKQLLRLSKIDTTRSILVRIKPDATGRVHSIYNPAGTETGRPASAATFLIEASTNLNNMPKREAVEALFDVRAVFEAPPGYVFVEADLAGAEVYPTAAAAGDLDLLERMRSGIDVHKWTASHIFKKPIETITKQERILGKTARHALNYGMQWKTFMENVNVKADINGVAITAAQAKQICAGYHALHPKLEQWWKRIHTELQAHATLTTCFGRKRTFYGRNRHEFLGETHREYIAHESQSTIADLCNRGLLRWWRQHDGKVGELIAQVYDSLLILAREEHADLCATLVKRCLTEEIIVHGITLTVPVDVKVMKTLAVLGEDA